MSNEPNQPMDTLLREAAKKRAAEAGEPFELHPVNRRVLQDEVTKIFGPVKPAVAKLGWTELLMALLPRLALGVGIFMVLGITVYMSLPRSSNRSQTFELSKVEPSSKPEELRLNLSPAGPPPIGESLASVKSGPIAQPMPTVTMSAEPGTVTRYNQATPAPSAPLASGGSGQPSQRADVLSKSQARAEPETLLSQARDADVLSKDKADRALRSRAITPAPTSRGAVSPEAGKEVATVDEKARGFAAPKPSAQPISAPSAAPKLAEAKQAGATVDQLKKSSEINAPVLPAETRKQEVALNDGLVRQQSVAPAAPVKQLAERRAANDASALYFKEAQPAATDPAVMSFADSTAPLPKSDAQANRLDFVQQDSRAIYRRNLQSPPLPKVLTRFSVVVADGRVTVTDVDGSVYSGSMVSTSAVNTSGLSGIHIRASGTKKNSGQNVTIDGTFDAMSAHSGLAATTRPLSAGGRLAGTASAVSDGATAGLQFQGRVSVGGTQFDILAVRAPMQP